MCSIKNIVFSHIVTKMIDRIIQVIFKLNLQHEDAILHYQICFKFFAFFLHFNWKVFLLSKANSATLDLIDKNWFCEIERNCFFSKRKKPFCCAGCFKQVSLFSVHLNWDVRQSVLPEPWRKMTPRQQLNLVLDFFKSSSFCLKYSELRRPKNALKVLNKK